MEDNIRLAGIETRLSNLSTEAAGLKSDVSTIKTDLGEVRRDVASINGGIGTVKWIVGGFLIAVVLAVLTLGRSFIRDTAREVVLEVVKAEMRGLDTRVQFGVFSPKTKVADDPLTFDWKLQQPISADELVSMTVEPLTSVPGVSISAQLANDGNTCRMVAKGNTDNMLAKLDDGIPGKVTITLKSH